MNVKGIYYSFEEKVPIELSFMFVQISYYKLWSIDSWQIDQFIYAPLTYVLEKEMATHSSSLAWRIPGTEESGGLPSMGLHRVVHDWSDLAATYTHPTPTCLYNLIWNSKYLLKETTEHVKLRNTLQSHWLRLNKNVLEGKETVSNLSK